METILYNTSRVLGITIIHSLWQGLFVYFLLRLVLMISGQLPASKKYLLAVTSLLAITGWFVYTLINEINIYNWLAIKPGKLSAMPLMLELPAGIHQFNDEGIRYYYSIEKYLPYITVIYIAGLLFNTTRLILARKKINTIRETMSIDIHLQQLVNNFAGTLNISNKVRIGLSRMVDVPCMVGNFKPVILLPFTLSTYLSAEEIEAILLHELAHIKRNDYLVNLLQQALSILLFFNPCALLINRIINEERENSCDDLVVKATADPINYAKALLKLEQTRQNDWKLALAATGKKYHLLNRIQRIMKTQKQPISVRPALLATLILVLGVSAITLLKPEIAQGKISVKAIVPVVKHLFTDTTKNSADVAPVIREHKSKKTTHSADARDDNSNTSSDADKKLKALTDDIDRKSQVLGSYYSSDKVRAINADMEKQSKAMQDLDNRPDLKKLKDEMEKASQDYSKTWGNDAKMQELTKQMGEMGRSVGAYYDSREFKQMNEELQKKYGIPVDEYYSDKNNHRFNDAVEDENHKKYHAELDSKIPTSVKQQTDQLKTMGEQMRAHYESPEFKAENQHVKDLADQIGKAYNSAAFKQQEATNKKINEQMSAYQNSPEIKKAQDELNASIKRMTDYINSPEYQKHLKELAKPVEDLEKTERPEKQEKPEKEEVPEN